MTETEVVCDASSLIHLHKLLRSIPSRSTLYLSRAILDEAMGKFDAQE